MLVAILNPLPGVAVLPLAMLWFGLNTNALLFVIANAAIWPIAINLDTGFKTVNQTIVSVGRNIGLSSARLVTDVLAPAALPYAISGLKTAWAFGWRTIIAAELIFGVAGAEGGLGTCMRQRKAVSADPAGLRRTRHNRGPRNDLRAAVRCTRAPHGRAVGDEDVEIEGGHDGSEDEVPAGSCGDRRSRARGRGRRRRHRPGRAERT